MITLLIALSIVALCEQKDLNDKTGKLDGKWRMVAEEFGGKPLLPEGSEQGKTFMFQVEYTFTPDHCVVKSPAGASRFIYKTDTSVSPRRIDFIPEDEKARKQAIYAIYEIKGDTLRIAAAKPGRRRPSAFKTSAGMGDTLFVLKRQKEQQK